MCSLLLKDLSADFYLLSLQLVLCRVAALKSLRISSKVQVICSFWSFRISEDILRNQKLVIGQDSFSTQCILCPISIILVFVSTTLLNGRVTDETLIVETAVYGPSPFSLTDVNWTAT